MCHKQSNKWKQCAIFWHVDNLKISHVEKDLVEDIPKQLTKMVQKRMATNKKQREGTGLWQSATGRSECKV